MSRVRVRAAAVLLAATSMLGCGGGDDGATTPPPDPPDASTGPTFTRVTQEVITQKACGGPLCHGLTAGGFTLTTKAALHADLVDQVAGGTLCGPSAGTTYIRVIPRDPENSLLYRKLSGSPPCGDPMPPASPPIGSEQLELVYDWIAEGAQND